ncbi:uncharacterized protein METZ01_LOCUS379215, partial [marine metagenome]
MNNKAVTTSTVVVFSPKPLTVQHGGIRII